MSRPLLMLAFFLSGASGLVFQTVWVRALTRYLGATTPALATVLGVFMAGLAIGSVLGGRLADRVRRPLRTYALVELGVAVAGLLAFYAILTRIGDLYVTLGRAYPESAWVAAAGRFGFVALCLLPPTVLMGMTLPLVTAYASRAGARIQSALGRLYAINTFGALCGVLATGFILLGAIGETKCLFLAAGMNIVAALLTLAVPVGEGSTAGQPRTVYDDTDYPTAARRWALVAFFASGFTALAYEVLWSRLLVLYLETSIYAFSAMLGLFLSGIAAGSWLAARRPSKRPLAEFGQLEIAIGCATAIGLLLYPHLDPTADPNYQDTSNGFRALDLLRVAIAFVLVAPVAFLFGRQFPVAVRCCARRSDGAGRLTGRAYAVNALGTILGTLGTGFVLIPTLGAAKSMVVLAVLNVMLGLILLGHAPAVERKSLVLASVFAATLFGVGVYFVGDPYLKTIEHRLKAEGQGIIDIRILAYGEGTAATCIAAGAENNQPSLSLLVDGQGMTKLVTETKLITHLPYLLANDPKRAMIVCFGMGTTTRSASKYPDLEIDAVDLVPQTFDYFHFYHDDADRVRRHPGLRFHVNDGRNQLLLSDKPYDLISVDPAPPLHSAGTVNLYSREFFELAKSRLSDGGVFCMWLPPARESEIVRVLKTFAEVYPDGCAWGGFMQFGYPGFYLTGGRRPIRPSLPERDAIAAKLAMVEDLGEWGPEYANVENLKKLYVCDCEKLLLALGDIPAIADDLPATEFPLWRFLFDRTARRDLFADVLRDPDSPFWKLRLGTGPKAGVANRTTPR